MEAFAETVNRELKAKIDKDAYAICSAMRRRQSARQRQIPGGRRQDRRRDQARLWHHRRFRRLDLGREHGIGLLKRPYLKLSRTEEEIETCAP